MAARHWVGGTGNWDASTTTHWSATQGGAAGASAPTAADDVFFDANSGGGTCTITTGAVARSISAATSTTIIAGSVSISLGNSTGSGLVLPTVQANWTYTGTITFVHTAGTAALTMSGIQLKGPITQNGVGGTLQLSEAFNSSTALNVTNGTFDVNSFGVTCSSFNMNAAGTRKLINTGTAAWTMNITGTAGFNVTSTATGSDFSAATVMFTNTTATTRSFNGGGFSYNTVQFTAVSTAQLTFAGGATITQLSVSEGKTLQFATGLTWNITSFNVTGTAAAPTLIRSSVAGTQHLLSVGTANVTYIDLKDSNVTPIFYAGVGSVNSGNNTGWAFGVYKSLFNCQAVQRSNYY